VGLLDGVVTLALFVLFIILAYGMVSNARAWRLTTRVSPGMAIGSWFIPVYCLKGPYDAIAGTNEVLQHKAHGRAPQDTGKSGLLRWWWWLLFCASQVIGSWLAALIAIGGGASAFANAELSSDYRLENQDDFLDAIRLSLTMQLTGQVLLVAAAIVGWFAVRHLAERHAECVDA
jgi:hypothetical protein